MMPVAAASIPPSAAWVDVPFAQDALVGNIPTEKVLEALQQRAIEPPVTRSSDSLLKATAGIVAKYPDAAAAD